MCRYFGKEEFIKWQLDESKQEEIFSYLRAQFMTKTRDEWVEQLMDKDVCIAPVLHIDEVFNDPQVLHRKMVFEMDHPHFGKIKQLGFPIKMSGTPASARLAPPELGQHTNEILTEIGYSDENIKAFRQQGVI